MAQGCCAACVFSRCSDSRHRAPSPASLAQRLLCGTLTGVRQVIYVDVDDTLIRSSGSKRIPVPNVVRYVERQFAAGAALYCWSTGGAEYAEAAAREVGIHHCFRGFLPKPNVLVDDQPVQEWRDLEQRHPLNCRESPAIVAASGSASREGSVDGTAESRNESEVIIRSACLGDYSEWRRLWDAYNAFYGRSGATALPVEVTESTWRRFFDEDEPVHNLIAEAAGGLVGLAHYVFHRSTIAASYSCYLQDLFTDERSRGRGVASNLIRAVYARAKAAGAHRVYWQTHEENRRARRLYDRVAERSGFIVYRHVL